MRHRYQLLLLVLSLGAALCGCAAGANPPVSESAPTSGDAPAFKAEQDTSKPSGVFFMSDTRGNVIQEYSASQTTSTPLLSFHFKAGFIGVDNLGNTYFTLQGDYACNSPCKVSVFNAKARFQRAIHLPAMRFLYVTRTGSLYGATSSCNQILQFAAGVKGTPNPIRAIDVRPRYCSMTTTNFDFTHWRLAADDSGRVYLLTEVLGDPSQLALLIWAPGASRNDAPIRTIVSSYMKWGIQGVVSNGSVWFVGKQPSLSQAYLFGPTANGTLNPHVVKIQSGWPSSLLVSGGRQLVYLTPGSCSVHIGPRSGGPSVATIPVQSKSCDGELWGTTF
jgi:hypothetical protein